MTSKVPLLDTTGVDLELLTQVAVNECRTQQVGLDRVAFLLQGFVYALASRNRFPTLEDALMLGRIIEPDGGGRLRTTPVTFTSGGSSAPPGTVEFSITHLFSVLDGEVPAAEFTEQFLWIHPFTDGNGRTALVLHNWVLGRLAAPCELPRYLW